MAERQNLHDLANGKVSFTQQRQNAKAGRLSSCTQAFECKIKSGAHPDRINKHLYVLQGTKSLLQHSRM
jgi:hypothetical protein